MTKNEITISNITFYRIIMWISVLSLIYFFIDLILILVIGIFFAVVLEPLIKKLIKINFQYKKFNFGFNRLTATFSIFMVLFLLIFLFLAKAFPFVVDQFLNFYNSLYSKLVSINNSGAISFGGESLKNLLNDGLKYADFGNFFNILKSSSTSLSSILSLVFVVFGGVLNFLLILVFTFYFCLEDKGVERLIRLLSPQEKFNSFVSIWNRAENKIQNWAEGQFVAAIIMGVIVFVSLLIAKMPYAFVFAILSFVGEMIPLVGLILSSVPAIIVAFLFVDIKFAIIIAIIFFIIAQIENYIVYPKVMDNKVGVSPLFVLLSILIGVKLLGFWGVVLAVPVAAVIIETIKDAYKHKME